MNEAGVTKEMLEKDSATKSATEQKAEDKIEEAETKFAPSEPSKEVKEQLQ